MNVTVIDLAAMAREWGNPGLYTILTRNLCGHLDTHPACIAEAQQRNYWTTKEAGDNTTAHTCAHGLPLNVYCGTCEP